MYQIVKPFGPTLLIFKVPQYIIDEIINYNKIYIENDHKDYLVSTNQNETTLDNNFKYYDELCKLIYEACKSYASFYGFDKSFRIEKDEDTLKPNIWVNVMQPGDNNPPHKHKGDLSGIIYVSDNTEIYKEKHSGVEQYNQYGKTSFITDLHDMPYNGIHYTNEGVSGDGIIFPSWLFHYVTPYKTNQQRITIAFNLREVQ